jgi:hypothetical protein
MIALAKSNCRPRVGCVEPSTEEGVYESVWQLCCRGILVGFS